uniref:TNFR-Cys domain-containing protein n=1 Tax=Bursaphelenchus xylophilus TaxID=6326 RepID=A0A1I7STJ1_BURXY
MLHKLFSVVILCSQLAYSIQESVSQECDEETFFDGYDCKRCATCGPTMYIKKACSESTDTVCDYCLNERPTLNEDFYTRCNDYRKLFENLKGDVSPRLHAHFEGTYQHYHGINWALASLVAAISVALILTINKCIRRPAFREVTITPPELTEEEKQNIIFAAEHLRNKRGKYHRLDYV